MRLFSLLYLLVFVMGSLQVCQTISAQEDASEREADFRYRNDHCQGPRPIAWPVEPDEGFEIDTERAPEVSVNHSKKSDYFGYGNVTADGFTIRGRVANSGTCIGGGKIARDARGHLNVNVKYWVKRAPESSELNTGTVTIHEDSSFWEWLKRFISEFTISVLVAAIVAFFNRRKILEYLRR